MGKNSKAFSLVEMLISLIVISLLISALSPLITKKLKTSDMTVGSFGKSDENIQKFYSGEPRGQQDCDKLNMVFVSKEVTKDEKNICVMKYNAGDGYYSENIYEIVDNVCIPGQSCNIAINDNSLNTTPTCRTEGETSGDGCVKSGAIGNYSSCNRTVCNYPAAKKLCEKMGFRLPTSKEIFSFSYDTNYSSSALGSNGLMLCSGGKNDNFDVCPLKDNTCNGTPQGNGRCHPYAYRTNEKDSDTRTVIYHFFQSTNTYTTNLPNGYTASTRCVTDNIKNIPKLEIDENDSSKCKEGFHKYGNECYKNINNCTTYVDSNKCVECESGYTLYNNTCAKGESNICYDYHCAVCSSKEEGTCGGCKPGYTLHNGKCYFGNLEGCKYASYNELSHNVDCNVCYSGYTKCLSGSCRLTSEIENKPCPKNTVKIGCVCVAKYNIGDGYYGESLSYVKQCKRGTTCNVKNGTSTTATAYDIEPACWSGQTSDNCNSKGGGYSGCNRIVCNWPGANMMCKSIGRRMPSQAEMKVIAENTYSNSTLNSEGLMFCDTQANNTVDNPGCDVGHSGCETYNSWCYPHQIWTSSFYGNTSALMRNLFSGNANNGPTGFAGGNVNLTGALSTRCVYDL